MLSEVKLINLFKLCAKKINKTVSCFKIFAGFSVLAFSISFIGFSHANDFDYIAPFDMSEPCSGNEEGISHCKEQIFICNSGRTQYIDEQNCETYIKERAANAGKSDSNKALGLIGETQDNLQNKAPKN